MMDFRKSGNIIVILICIAVVSFIFNKRSDKSLVADIQDNIVQSSLSQGTQDTLSKSEIIECTNAERVARGLPDLTENELLNTIAEARALDMLEKQYFAHVSPTGEQASDKAQEVGYRYKIIAENIASGYFPTSKKMVDGWMQSPGHRKNILSPDIKEIGVAIVNGSLHGRKTTLGVQIFGRASPPVSSKTCSQPPESLEREIENKKGEIASLRERLTLLKEELEEENRSIQSDKRAARSDPQDMDDLNTRIKAYNEKGEWYNRTAADINAKTAVLQRMIDEYNLSIQNYQICRDTDSRH